MLYEPHRDTFLFSPFRSLSTDAGWNRVATNFTVSNCFVPRYLYIYIYVYGWKKRKDPTMEFFFFSIPLFFQLVVIFVIFLRKRIEQQAPISFHT